MVPFAGEVDFTSQPKGSKSLLWMYLRDQKEVRVLCNEALVPRPSPKTFCQITIPTPESEVVQVKDIMVSPFRFRRARQKRRNCFSSKTRTKKKKKRNNSEVVFPPAPLPTREALNSSLCSRPNPPTPPEPGERTAWSRRCRRSGHRWPAPYLKTKIGQNNWKKQQGSGCIRHRSNTATCKWVHLFWC